MSAQRLLAGSTIATVIVGLALAFALTGSPAHQRELALDRRRVELLQRLMLDIDNRYAGSSMGLPAALPDAIVERDPVTNAPLAYHRRSASAYTVCAAFAQPSPQEARNSYAEPFAHGAGRNCFERSLPPTR
jgi:type II secretory pathway pseudopilin PulG